MELKLLGNVKRWNKVKRFVWLRVLGFLGGKLREREREREIEFVGLKNLLWASVEEFVSELQFAFVIGLQPNSDVKYIFLVYI